MKRILFVDDEPRILDGLRRMLRGRRHEWEMSFANGGRAAMADLESGPFDVVVTDMRMPGMDGIELLTQVQLLHPETLRLILSGHTKPAGGARAARVAHQFLAKPSGPDDLRAAIEGTCAKDVEVHRGLRALVGRIGAVPVDRDVLDRLRIALAGSDQNCDELLSIIAGEPWVAAKVLQVVNSAFFGVAPQVEEIDAALGLLTRKVLRELVENAGVFRPVSRSDALFEELASHRAQAVAGAVAITREAGAKRGGAIYAASLLHDIGKLILAEGLGARYTRLTRSAAERGVPLHVVEQTKLGTTHAAVGAYLLARWNLPDSIVRAVADHHLEEPVRHCRSEDCIPDPRRGRNWSADLSAKPTT